MENNSGIFTPNSSRYELRSRTPTTPKTPSTPSDRVLRCSSTPLNNGNIVTEHSNTALKCTPIMKKSVSTPKTDEKLVFRTPMSYKPKLIGNKPVPSPSRQEIWRQELGLDDDPSSDKENSSSEDEENQQCQASLVEYRALQKVLAERNAQRDESLLVIKSHKDMIRHYKSRLEKEECTKKQQLKIMKKIYEDQIEEKDTLIDNINSIIQEQEERIKELEDGICTPRGKTRNTRTQRKQDVIETRENNSKLVEEIRRLQSDRVSLQTQLNNVQLELITLKQDTTEQVNALKETIVQLEKNNIDNIANNESNSQRNHTFINNKSMNPSSSSDVEKKTGILQAENTRLLQELTEMKNAQTKAVTVNKLTGHRQQQLEDEIKRLKEKLVELEDDLKRKTNSLSDNKLELDKICSKNHELMVKNGELAAKIAACQTKSSKDITASKVCQVETESLRKQYDICMVENQLLKQTNEEKKKELYEVQSKVNYLERLVESTKSNKDSEEASFWKELEQINKDHESSIKQLKEQLTLEKKIDIEMLENRLVNENKKELHSLMETMNKKHKLDIERMENLQKSSSKQEKEISRMKAEISQLLSKLESDKHQHQNELDKLLLQFSSEKEKMLKTHDGKLKDLETKLNEANITSLNQQELELQREKDNSLRMLEEKLISEHKISMIKMESTYNKDIKEAKEKEREKCRNDMKTLQENYSQLVDQITKLKPVLSTFVESYILLQKQVAQFPKIMRKTVKSTINEVTLAISGINEYNKELVNKYQKEMKLRKQYHNELVELRGNIRVFCRIRPVIKEDGQGQQSEVIVSLDKDDDGVLYVNSKGRSQTFDVDKVFGENSSQIMVFEEMKSLVTSCIDGYNVCIFAYGQTGSGKTYTMEGTSLDPGINQRALKELFTETSSRLDWEYTITLSVIEIYNEMIRDLLGEDTGYKMEVKMNPDGGYHIPGLSYVVVKSPDDVNEWFKVGQQNRATAATNMNEHSSRSHALLCITVIGCNITTGAKSTGKLNLVDLAGSERVSKSKADGARLKEAQSINKSLSSLGDVIYALRSKQSHIPYRNSKLTYLLQDSLGGDSKTLMIAQIAPVRKNEGETICSLNFAQRVRNVELGSATRKVENCDGTETDLGSPARVYSTPQKMIKSSNLLSATPTGSSIKGNTPSHTPNKAATPNSSKLTPVRQTRRK
ncbi:microtubule motor [Mactra antiquata]